MKKTRSKIKGQLDEPVKNITPASASRAETVALPESGPEGETIGIQDGYKRPSITDVKTVYTKEEFKALIEAYKIQNPKKYELKKAELEAKLRRL